MRHILEPQLLHTIGDDTEAWRSYQKRAVFYRLVVWLACGSDERDRSATMAKCHLKMALELEDKVERTAASNEHSEALKALARYEREQASANEKWLLTGYSWAENLRCLRWSRKTTKKNPRPHAVLTQIMTVGELALSLIRLKASGKKGDDRSGERGNSSSRWPRAPESKEG